MNNLKKPEFLYKVLVVGDINTGKTSIIKKYVHNVFTSYYKSTIGVDFALKVIDYPDKLIRMQLWDIAGQERFGNMTRVYYKEAVGAFVVFDVSTRSSFEAVKKWKIDIDAKVKINEDVPIPVILLVNKIDTIQPDENGDRKWFMTPDQMDEYCKENGFETWFETSAKEGINLDKSGHKIADMIYELIQKNPQIIEDPKIVITPEDLKEQDCKCTII